MKTCLASCVLAVSLSLLAGCATTTPYDAGAPASADDQLAADIVNRLATDAVTRSCNFGVTVEGGVATIEGAVPTETVRARAIGVVRSTEGVVNVVDKLTRYRW